MLRRTLLAAVVVLAALAGPSTRAQVCQGGTLPSVLSPAICENTPAEAAPAPTNGCSRNFTMGEFIRYGRRVLPVPTAGQGHALAVMARCMWARRLRLVARAWRRRHELHLGRHVWANSTSYSSCDSGSTTSMGTTARFGEVAVLPGALPLGSWIYMDHPVYGRRLFRVEDHIGSGSELDFFAPYCGWANWWGRREVGYRVVLR